MVKPKKKTKTKLKDSPRGKQSHVKMTTLNSPPPAQQTEQQKKPPKQDGFTESQIQEYGEAFMRFDEDRDGSVTYAELIELMKYLKIDTKKSAALSILDDIDLNGNDLVEFEEFLLLIKLQNCDTKQLVNEAFKVLDPGGTGVITAESLEQVCANLNLSIPKDELNEMVAKADPEGKGMINIKELRTLMRETTQMSTADDNLDSERSEKSHRGRRKKRRSKKRRKMRSKELWRAVWMYAFKVASVRKIHGNMDMYRGDGNKIRGFPRIPEPVQFVGKPISLPPTTRKSVHSTLSHRSLLGSTSTRKTDVSPFRCLFRNETHLGMPSLRREPLPIVRATHARYKPRYSMYYTSLKT